MITVIDQAKPWLMPSSAFAATTQPQLGPQAIMNGTGRPTSQPRTSICLRPWISAKCPETRLATALTTPKLTMKETTIVVEAILNSCAPMSGTTVRSNPTMPPTKALISTRSENCRQFSRRPSRISDDVAEVMLSVRSPSRIRSVSVYNPMPLIAASGRQFRSHIRIAGANMSADCCDHHHANGHPGYRRILWLVLGINSAMFAVEIGAGLAAGSASLQADALDFLSDAANYLISLVVVAMAT